MAYPTVLKYCPNSGRMFYTGNRLCPECDRVLEMLPLERVIAGPEDHEALVKRGIVSGQ